jgi:hypothetical protein
MTLQNHSSVKGNNLSISIFRSVTAAILAIFLFLSTGEVLAQGAPVKLKVVKASCYGSLAPQGGNTYGAWNMVDGNIATTWAVSLNNRNIYGGDGDLDPSWIQGPYFEVPCKKLSHIVIRNGYAKSASAYINNSRASYIFFEIETSDGLEGFGAKLKDTPDPQRLDAPLNESWNNNITTIQMGFPCGSFIKGAKWNDLCITEIEFWGWR